MNDAPEMIALLQAMLPADWCASLSAHNGVQGLALARSERPDAIYLDLMLPGTSGIEILEELRADPETAEHSPLILPGARCE